MTLPRGRSFEVGFLRVELLRVIYMAESVSPAGGAGVSGRVRCDQITDHRIFSREGIKRIKGFGSGFLFSLPKQKITAACLKIMSGRPTHKHARIREAAPPRGLAGRSILLRTGGRPGDKQPFRQSGTGWPFSTAHPNQLPGFSGANPWCHKHKKKNARVGPENGLFQGPAASGWEQLPT